SSDLDDAIAAGRKGDDANMRKLAASSLDNAVEYGNQTAANEIARLPEKDRAQLAARAGTDANAEQLAAAYRQSGTAQYQQLKTRVQSGSEGETLSILESIRAGIQAAPDDRTRKQRQFWLAWAAPLSKRGLQKVEQHREQARPALMAKVYAEA